MAGYRLVELFREFNDGTLSRTELIRLCAAIAPPEYRRTVEMQQRALLDENNDPWNVPEQETHEPAT